MKPSWLLSALAAGVLGCGEDPDHALVAGTIEIREVTLASMTSGRLRSLYVDEGDTVRTGDTVAVLTQPGLDQQIAEREARYRVALARRDDLEEGARVQELRRARAALESVLADSARAASDAARVDALFDSTAASARERDAAIAADRTTTARVRQLREELALLEAGTRSQQVVGARREAEAARAAVEALQAVRGELSVTAPADGVILLRLAEPGEVLQPGTPIARLGLVHRPWVRAYVDQAVIGRVRVGAAVRVMVDSFPDSSFAGVVSEISAEAEFVPRVALTERERADLVFAIKVEITAEGGRLKPGMPVDLAIDLVR
ncbi:MAG TPA: HlyD family efflux transporter periplasmic adaptor subunit [Gemmatimonadales bacterium]